MKNFKKAIALTTFLVFCSFFIYGQQLKTYVDKDYDGPCVGTGTLTYTYYEGKNGDFVKHGKYSANASYTPQRYWNGERFVTETQKYSASANYKDGWLNGTLTITVTKKLVYTNQTNVYVSTLTANFNNGMPHGSWKMTRTENGTKKFSLSANFSNGMLVGAFDLNGTLKGQLDNNGFFSGKWTKKDGTDYEYNFINHVYVSMYERNAGKVIWSRPETDAEKELFKDYAEGQITTEELRKYGYSVDTATDIVGTKRMWDILFEGLDCFGLDDIGGNKTIDRNRSEKVTMGKYISMTKFKNVWIPSRLQRMEEKKSKAEEEKRKAEEEKRKAEEEEEKKRKAEEEASRMMEMIQQGELKRQKTHTDSVHVFIINSGYTSLVNAYNDEVANLRSDIENNQINTLEKLEKLGELTKIQKTYLSFADIEKQFAEHHASIINSGYTSLVDAYNDEVAKMRTDIENNQANTSEKLDKLKGLIKIQEIYLSFADIEKQFAEYNEMLVNEGISEFPDMMELSDYLNKNYKLQYSSNKIDETKKKADSYFQVLKELMNLTKYRKNISRLNDTIMVSSEPFPDIVKSYTDMRAASDLKVTHDLKNNAERFVSHYNTQHFYQRFIELRKSFAQKDAQINQNKQHEDVVMRYNDFVKNCDLSITQDTAESYSRVLLIVKTQDSCLKFLSLRDEITNNDNMLSGNKTIKNIAKVYDTYMKSADLIWIPDLNCCNKLRKVIDIQHQFLTAVKALNVAELDKRVKKLKDKSLENVLKEIK